ncbi:MAG: SPASM domain-containing protein [Lachnospiraceae bacterium]
MNLNCVDENYMQNQAKWYSWTKFDNPECKECKVLPICMGGCPLHTIDEKLNDDYKCSTYKYNMESMLNLIATKYLDDAY